ncbi:protein-export chaperone SecB [Aquibaculum arenosum]|uniref:Protein-export protein SecB n=1 Tax=Aquibaculum arenosum TaxID=3032591 RepID=A0ABT5YKW6_9PROT|nr:protein-export chaperone SecB [Fodinicurvata sp. CAU 1616]MDF2095517.1 protein-export chaperone SecB [Fodinicurvata sp. CAU 1616]
MSDQNSSAPTGAATGGADQTQAAQNQGSENKQEAPIVIHGQYVKDLSFESPRAPAVLASMRQSPQLDIQMHVNARPIQQEQQKRLYEVMLKIRASAKHEEKAAFMIELDYGALITLGSMIPEDRIEPVLLIDVATMIFPFARRIVADITREGGFPPVLINPVDFVSLYRQRKAQEQQAQAEATQGAPAGNA